jgi:hypothetical protein
MASILSLLLEFMALLDKSTVIKSPAIISAPSEASIDRAVIRRWSRQETGFFPELSHEHLNSINQRLWMKHLNP